MKLWFIVAVLLLSTTLLHGQTSPPAAPTAPAVVPPAVPAPVGRYQMTVAGTAGNPEVWLVDTQTGDTWHRQGNRWLYAGNPTQDPGPNAPAPPAGRSRAGRSSAPRPPETAPQILPER